MPERSDWTDLQLGYTHTLDTTQGIITIYHVITLQRILGGFQTNKSTTKPRNASWLRGPRMLLDIFSVLL